MPIGVILLFIASVLVFFGLAQRVLDHLKLSDLGAIVFLIAMIAGSFINIPILRGRVFFSLNVGGGILPLALGLYVLLQAGSSMEWGRALAGTVITAGVIWGFTRVVSFEPGHTILDPLLIFGLIAGVIGYLAGRSRRGAFIAATWGLLLVDLANLATLLATGQSGRVVVGGAGIFDTIVLAGFLALILAELVGETREHLAGGPETGPHRPEGLQDHDMEMSWEEEPGRVEFAEELVENPADEEDPWELLFEEKLALPAQPGEEQALQEIYDFTYEVAEEDGEDEEGDGEEEDPCYGDDEEVLSGIIEVATKTRIELGGGVELYVDDTEED